METALAVIVGNAERIDGVKVLSGFNTCETNQVTRQQLAGTVLKSNFFALQLMKQRVSLSAHVI